MPHQRVSCCRYRRAVRSRKKRKFHGRRNIDSRKAQNFFLSRARCLCFEYNKPGALAAATYHIPRRATRRKTFILTAVAYIHEQQVLCCCVGRAAVRSPPPPPPPVTPCVPPSGGVPKAGRRGQVQARATRGLSGVLAEAAVGTGELGAHRLHRLLFTYQCFNYIDVGMQVCFFRRGGFVRYCCAPRDNNWCHYDAAFGGVSFSRQV